MNIIYEEDYFSVEMLNESPLLLYEAQILNIGNTLDDMISESLNESVILEASIKETFSKWVEIILNRLRELKKEVTKKIRSYITDIAKATAVKAEYKNVKIPVIAIKFAGGSKTTIINTGKDMHINRSEFKNEIDSAVKFVEGSVRREYRKATFEIGKNWDDTNLSMTNDEFKKTIEKMVKDVDNITNQVYKAIEDIEKYAEKNFYEENEDGKTVVKDAEGISRAKDAISYLEKLDRASYQYLLRFIKQR